MLVASGFSCSGDSTDRFETRGRANPVVVAAETGTPAPKETPKPNFRAGVKGSSTAPELLEEEDPWEIVPFTDPRDSSEYDIIDGRVIIALKDQPVLPVVSANYFDEELSDEDEYFVDFGEVVPETFTEDEDIADFLETEDLTVYAEWPEVGGLAVQLPEGTSVEEAIDEWPTEYSEIIEAVDADEVCFGASWPADGEPNDEKFPNQWPINDDSYYPDPSDYQINIQSAWHADSGGESFGLASQYIAILDTGVDYSTSYLDDLTDNSSPYGCNVGDRRASTAFDYRASGGGRPWQSLLDESAISASSLGHGTCVAGIASADINNDPAPPPPLVRTGENGKAIAGIARNTKYFPIAVKAHGYTADVPAFSTSALLNGFTAIGCVRRVYDPKVLYGPSFFCPKYTVVVVNCSWTTGKPGVGTTVGLRHLDALSPFILFACSSGNNDSSSQSYFPANYSAALSVCDYSLTGYRQVGNYDSSVDIAAPGLAIWSIDMYGTNAHSQNLGFAAGRYYQFLGTSAAAPHVAAVAAVLSGIDTNGGTAGTPHATSAQVRTAILNTREMDLPDSDLAYKGRMNAAAAIEYIEP